MGTGKFMDLGNTFLFSPKGTKRVSGNFSGLCTFPLCTAPNSNDNGMSGTHGFVWLDEEMEKEGIWSPLSSDSQAG